MNMKLLSSFVLFQLISANVISNSLKLSCDCENLILCQTNGIISEKIEKNTFFVVENCENLKSSDVEELHISWARNGIAKSLREFTKLAILKVSHSVLTILSPEVLIGLNNLEKLVLAGNEITDLSQFPELVNLEKLFLFKNRIEMIKKQTFCNLKSLRILSLEENQIFHINSEAFAENQNLEELNLNRNDLSFLEPTIFHCNSKLKEIGLNHNKLKYLHRDTFTNNLDLEVLRLYGNELESLHQRLFIKNKFLRWIELGTNRLMFLDSKLFKNMENLEFVDLADNDCIEGSFPIKMNFEHLLKLVDRNCHYLAAYYYEFL